jgi:hypothetical protein
MMRIDRYPDGVADGGGDRLHRCWFFFDHLHLLSPVQKRTWRLRRDRPTGLFDRRPSQKPVIHDDGFKSASSAR